MSDLPTSDRQESQEIDPVLDFEAERFWGDAAAIAAIDIHVALPEKPLAILEKLGPSPFERGGFPLIGFLATTYDKVSRYALERTQSPALLQRGDAGTPPPVS